MSFLALAPWQAWLSLALTAAAIVAIFLLRIRRREVVVSSTLLWRRLLERRRRRSWLELLRRLLSLALALAIGLSLVLSFARAELGGEAPRRLVVLVDTTVSMGALTSDGRTRLQRARALAADLVAGGTGRDTFTLYDASGWPVVSATNDRGALLRGLDELAAEAPELRLPSIEPGVEAWLISDGVSLRRLPARWHLLDVYQAADNVGITAFEVRALPTDARRHEAFLELANLAAEERTLELRLLGGERLLFRRVLTLAAGERYRTHLDLSPLAGGPLRAEIGAGGDALPADDRAFAFVPPQTDREIWLVGEDAGSFTEVLVRTPHVRVSRMSAAEYQRRLEGRAVGLGGMAARGAADPPPPDGVVFVGVAPGGPPVVPAVLVAPPPAPWLPERGPAVELDPALPEVSGAVSELLRDVDVHDLGVRRAHVYSADGARVLVRVGGVPLLLENPGPPRWLLWSFDPVDSDLPQSEAFPILVDNLLTWFDRFLPARRVPPGEYALPPGSRVTAPDGQEVETRPIAGGVAFLARAEGVYLVEHAGRVQPWVVTANHGGDASVIERPRDRWHGETPPRRPRGRPLSPWLLPAVLALLALEGFTYHRRITL